MISIFLISILCSLIFLFFFSDIGPAEHRLPPGDYFTHYKPAAISLLQGKGLTVDGEVDLHIGPVFPVILSGIFGLSQVTGIDELDLVVAFNVILAALAAGLLFLLAFEIFNKKIALIASFLWLSYPFNLWFIKNPNTEVPFIPLLFLGIFLYLLALKRKKLRFVFLAGLFLGLTSLTRLIGLFLPLFLALLIFLFLRGDPKKSQFLLAVILLMGTIVIMLPWLIYTISETGGFIPLSTRGAVSIVYGITVLSAPVEGRNRAVFSDDVTALIERVKSEDLSSFAKLSQFFSQELINRPISVLKLISLKLARSWYATSQQWWEGKILAVQILYLLPGLLGLLYLIKTNKDKIRDIILLLSIVAYFWGITFLNVSILRYMVPAMGLVIIFSAITVNMVIDRLVKKISYH